MRKKYKLLIICSLIISLVGFIQLRKDRKDDKQEIVGNEITPICNIDENEEALNKREEALLKTSFSDPVYFDDILGFTGYYIDETYPYGYTSRVYYTEDLERKTIFAKSYGFNLNDKLLDIDGDGKKELVCNCQTGGDCHKEVYVYKRTDEKTLVGYVNWLTMEFEDLYYWGSNAVSTEFDENAFMFKINYSAKDRIQGGKNTYADVSIIKYSVFIPEENLPFIDIKEAYEKYSDK